MTIYDTPYLEYRTLVRAELLKRGIPQEHINTLDDDIMRSYGVQDRQATPSNGATLSIEPYCNRVLDQYPNAPYYPLSIKLMSYQEYESKVKDGFNYYKLGHEYFEEALHRGSIRKMYNSDIRNSYFSGDDRMNPSGLVYTCYMLYPEFTDGEGSIDEPAKD